MGFRGLQWTAVPHSSFSGRASYRVPDHFDGKTLHEVKNVANLSLTAQLRDYFKFVELQRGTVHMRLVVRLDTDLSGPLKREIHRLEKKGLLTFEPQPLPKR